MSKRYYKEFINWGEVTEWAVVDRKRQVTDFNVYCEDESHADALVKELNRRGYEIGEFHAIKIANELKVKS
jgi:hypothetical protein